jgi:hypothetical protein
MPCSQCSKSAIRRPTAVPAHSLQRTVERSVPGRFCRCSKKFTTRQADNLAALNALFDVQLGRKDIAAARRIADGKAR